MKLLLPVLGLIIFTLIGKQFQQASPIYKTISIYPVNETKQFADLTAFTNKLIKACEVKDTAYVLSIVDDDVVISHGGGVYGKAAFKDEFLKQYNGFEKLRRALLLGGTIEKDEENLENTIYLYPYLQSGKLYEGKADTIELDPYLTAVGVTNSVSVYSRPSEKSKVKTTLIYPLLQLDPTHDFTQDKWFKIITFDNKLSGYVKTEQLYQLADMTLNIERKSGGFVIVSVAPYD